MMASAMRWISVPSHTGLFSGIRRNLPVRNPRRGDKIWAPRVWLLRLLWRLMLGEAMMDEAGQGWRPSIGLLVAVLVPMLFLMAHTALQVRFGLNLSDEGFLWYGTQRTVAGEVPLLDFMAYEPGRYYWTAAWMWLSGSTGIVAMRWAAVAFEAVAVAAVSVTVWRTYRSVSLASLCGVDCVLAMYPWHGRYEPSMALLQMAALAWLLERPSDRRFVVNGVVLGVAAVFGRNMLLYGLVGLAVAAVLATRVEVGAVTRRRVGLCLVGAAIGAAPLVGMLLLVDGYAAAVWTSVLRHFELGATNIAVPVPTPWTVHYAGAPWHTQVALFFLGLSFLALPAVGIALPAWTLLKDKGLAGRQPVLVASAIMCLPWAHYVLSRANVEHLSRGITPLVVFLSLAAASRIGLLRLAVPAVLAVVLFQLFQFEGPSAERWVTGRHTCLDVQVGRDTLCVSTRVGETVERTRAVVAAYVHPGETVLIVPFHVTLYPALDLRAPVWEIYPLLRASSRLETEEIRKIEAARTRLAIVDPSPLDGRSDLAYETTHPMTTIHLLSHFEVLPAETLPSPFVALVRR